MYVAAFLAFPSFFIHVCIHTSIDGYIAFVPCVTAVVYM